MEVRLSFCLLVVLVLCIGVFVHLYGRLRQQYEALVSSYYNLERLNSDPRAQRYDYLNHSLSDIESRLNPSEFMRCHKSDLVNLSCISKIEPYGRLTFSVRLKGTNTQALMTAQNLICFAICLIKGIASFWGGCFIRKRSYAPLFYIEILSTFSKPCSVRR